MAAPNGPFDFMKRAAATRGNRRETVSQVEMGAQRLEQLGPEGAQWAQMLRTDPSSALKMADNYGGFAAI